MQLGKVGGWCKGPEVPGVVEERVSLRGEAEECRESRR